MASFCIASCSLTAAVTEGVTKTVAKVEDPLFKEMVSNNKVMLFAKSGCDYATRVKYLLNNHMVDYKTLEVDTHEHGEKMMAEITK